MIDAASAFDLIEDARMVLQRDVEATQFVWPRAAAVLGRQSLEMSLDQLWIARAPGTEACSARVQLICLSSYLEPELAGAVGYAYSALSRACHHHPYELAPSQAEIERWLDTCERLALAVGD